HQPSRQTNLFAKFDRWGGKSNFYKNKTPFVASTVSAVSLFDLIEIYEGRRHKKNAHRALWQTNLAR
ncbi:MAG: hypothetical protein ACP5O6_04995, partial [Candidatus Baltobacteraceae bacterium]